MTPAAYDGPPLDQQRLLETLHRHHVDYLVIGGVGAQAHGARRVTGDLDCLPDTSTENLTRLAGALDELHARLRVGGMSDHEAQSLPLRLDAHSLAVNTIWNLTTDAGPIDIVHGMPDRHGARQSYARLLPHSEVRTHDGIPVRIAALRDIIDSKMWADRPKDHEALAELRSLPARPSPAPRDSPRSS